jgi:NADP-dependent 3-hydroxy acid dehydrogenase YdfG
MADHNDLKGKAALIVGAGSGLSASIARKFAGAGMKIALAARTVEDLAPLAGEIGAKSFACDAVKPDAVAKLYADLAGMLGDPYAVVYNASYRTRGPVLDLDPAEVEKSLAVTAFGGFLVAQEAARRMVPKGAGAILFTGASASVKGYAQSAPFAMGKFALRGLAQSMARELAPQWRRDRALRRDGRRHPLGAPPRGPRPSRRNARSRRHCGKLFASPHPTSQRLDVGDRGAALGREILTAPASARICVARSRSPGLSVARGFPAA